MVCLPAKKQLRNDLFIHYVITLIDDITMRNLNSLFYLKHHNFSLDNIIFRIFHHTQRWN